MVVKIGPPVEMCPYELDDERGFKFYDAAGFCCGSVSLFSSGSLYGRLVYGDVLQKHTITKKETP
jgi:hypothetical protein